MQPAVRRGGQRIASPHPTTIKELEQTSIVRSMLMPKHETDAFECPVTPFNGFIDNGIDNPNRYSPVTTEETKEIECKARRRSHSDSDGDHQSDSNNLSDDCSSKKTRRPSKLTKVTTIV